jgi:hypothetical protein
MESVFAWAMAGAASAHQAATASREQNSQQRAGRRRRTSAEPQRAQQGATAAAAAAPAALDNLSRLKQLADASPQVAQLRRLQALADAYYAPVTQLAGGPEEEEPIQGQFASAELQPQVQQAPRANITGLPDILKAGVESLSGMSLDHVKVHYNSAQPAQLNALACAQGSDIHVAPGEEKHLPHEAWHIVQQAQGRVQPTMQMKDGVPVNDDAGLEREADVMGARALGVVGNVVQGAASGVVQRQDSGASVAQVSAVFQLHKVVSDPRHWSEEDTKNLFRMIPELLEIRESLLGIDVEDWTWDLKAKCNEAVNSYHDLQGLIKKYIVAENWRREQFGKVLKKLNPDDVADHITMIAARVRWTLKVIGSGEFDDDVPRVPDVDQPKETSKLGAIVSSTPVVTGASSSDKGVKDDEADKSKSAKADKDPSKDAAPSGTPRLVAKPRLPAAHAPKKSPEEVAKDLHQFEVNIGLLAEKVISQKPVVVEGHEIAIARKLGELNKMGGEPDPATITQAYNELPSATADYWKHKVAHESLMEGLALIVKKAKEPKGYPVDVAKFNAMFGGIISRELGELMLAVQSLMRLAPNRQDLMEATIDGVARDTTGINCGKTIGSGFNAALGELAPPESAVKTLCNAANKRLMAAVVDACVVKTKGRGDLPDDVRRSLIGKILTITISGVGSIGALLPLVTPEAVKLIQDMLRAMYTPEAIAAACKDELGVLAANLSTAGPAAVKANVQLERISNELNLRSMYELIGPDFFDDFELVADAAHLTKIAIEGGLLCVSAEPGGLHASDDPSALGANLVASGTKSGFPKKLGDVVTLSPNLSAKDNLYIDGGKAFVSRWGFYDQAENIIAKNKLRKMLIESAVEVLNLHVPPSVLQEAIDGAIKKLRRIDGAYRLEDAEHDFALLSYTVVMTIEMHNTEQNAFN